MGRADKKKEKKMPRADKKIKKTMGRAVFENVVGRAAPRPSIDNFERPGRAAAYLLKKKCPSSRNLMDRVGPRPMRYGLYTDRSALPMNRPTCFQWPIRAADNEVWRTTATSTCQRLDRVLGMLDFLRLRGDTKQQISR